jgi:hypothetical protein
MRGPYGNGGCKKKLKIKFSFLKWSFTCGSMNNTVFYNQFVYQQSLRPSRGIIDLSCKTYSFTAVSTKRLSAFSQLTAALFTAAFPQLTAHNSFFTTHSPTKQALNT